MASVSGFRLGYTADSLFPAAVDSGGSDVCLALFNPVTRPSALTPAVRSMVAEERVYTKRILSQREKKNH